MKKGGLEKEGKKEAEVPGMRPGRKEKMMKLEKMWLKAVGKAGSNSPGLESKKKVKRLKEKPKGAASGGKAKKNSRQNLADNQPRIDLIDWRRREKLEPARSNSSLFLKNNRGEQRRHSPGDSEYCAEPEQFVVAPPELEGGQTARIKKKGGRKGNVGGGKWTQQKIRMFLDPIPKQAASKRRCLSEEYGQAYHESRLDKKLKMDLDSLEGVEGEI
jgi:hypothetical protein